MRKIRIALVPTVVFLLVLLVQARWEIAARDRYINELHIYTAALENDIMKTERVGTEIRGVSRCRSCEELFFHDADTEPELCPKCAETLEVAQCK